MYTLSIVIPCYNEAATVGRLLRAVRAAPVDNKQVIVVDDGSTDGTAALLQGELRPLIDVLVVKESNRGKGYCLREGIRAATGDYVIFQDADLEYDPAEYPRLLKPLLEDKADVVYGSRFLGGDSHRVLFFWHFVGNRVITLLCNLFSNLNMSDIECCYKVFRRPLLQGIALSEDRFGVEPEVTLKVAAVPGVRIYEVGISYSGRTYAEGKKIGWRDGVSALRCILKYGLLRRR
ncbi:MAG TPA: glycosyltransferase family 2 protein [Gammaproteobacteria bacterium]